LFLLNAGSVQVKHNIKPPGIQYLDLKLIEAYNKNQLLVNNKPVSI